MTIRLRVWPFLALSCVLLSYAGPLQAQSAAENGGGEHIHATARHSAALEHPAAHRGSPRIHPLDTSSCVSGDTHVDSFDGSMNSAWRQWIQKSGPTFSLTASPGCEELTIPSGHGSFDSWYVPGIYTADNAPELLRSDNGPTTNDWLALTKLIPIALRGGI